MIENITLGLKELGYYFIMSNYTYFLYKEGSLDWSFQFKTLEEVEAWMVGAMAFK